MLITPDYCRLTSHYNLWQNNGLRQIVEAMPDAELRADRGAFFGSILGTLNHLLWGDQIWLHRLDGGPRPTGSIADSVNLTPTAAVWGAERFRTDGRLTRWASGLRAVDLIGNLTWTSGAQGREISQPLQTIVIHLFNHQTHHRGQVHAMLTAAGQKPGDTDLIFMPPA